MSADVPEDVRALPKLHKRRLFQRALISLEGKKGHKSSCVKNNLCGFVSRAREIILDARDRCL